MSDPENAARLPGTPVEFLDYLRHTVDPENIDRLHHLLSNRRRRLVVARVFVLAPTETIETRRLARQIAAIETGTAVERVSSDDYETVYNGLIQTHLPALADARIITYDARSRHIERGTHVQVAGLIAAATIAITHVLGFGSHAERSP